MDPLLEKHQKEAKRRKRPLLKLLKREGSKVISTTEGGFVLTTRLFKDGVAWHSWRLLNPPVSRIVRVMRHEPERATAPLPPKLRVERERRKIRRADR